jgi:hypothetical protein
VPADASVVVVSESFWRSRLDSDRDLPNSAPVCIVNEAFVRQHLGGREPIGAFVRIPNLVAGAAQPIVAREIVGVIKQVTVQAARLDRDLPLSRMRTMDDLAAESALRPRLRAGLVGAFAGLAPVLAPRQCS